MSSSERTPLLGSTGGNSDRSSVYGPSGIRHGRSQLVEDTDDETPSDIESVQTSTQKSHAATTSPTKRIIRGLLCYVLLCLGILALLVLAGSHLIAGRLLSDIIERPDGLQDLAEKSLVLEGPSGAQVLGWDQDSVKVALTGRAGVNVYAGLEEELRQHGFVSGMQKTMLRWGVRQADKVSIDSQEIHILAPHRSSHFPLLTITIQDPVTLPLRYSPLAPRDDKQLEWLDDVRLSLRIQLHAPADIVKLALDSWENEQLQFIAKAPKIRVSFTGRLLRFMGRLAIFKMDNLSEVVSLQVPRLSFLEDPSQLINITSYAIEPNPHKDTSDLTYSAKATLENPFVTRVSELPQSYQNIILSMGNPAINLPWPVMADAYILGPHRDTVNFSRATLMPFDMTLKQSYVNVSIHGLVRPENTADLDPALSNLLSNYLSGRETPIKAHPVPTPAMPAFLRDLLIHLPLISLNLPGSPDPDAQILQNVAIRQMRIDGTGPDSGILVSGSVVGDLVLPDGLDGLAKAIELKKLWPDVLVFDGSPNWTLDNKDFPPDPLPQGAFARLSPQDWSAVRTEVVEKEGHQVVQLEMKMSGAPMTVLPGRSDLFRSYMAKVLFGTGDGPHGQVRTGIWGFADVKAKLEPMPPLTLEDVFVQGEFLVSKSDVLGLRWLFS